MNTNYMNNPFPYNQYGGGGGQPFDFLDSNYNNMQQPFNIGPTVNMQQPPQPFQPQPFQQQPFPQQQLQQPFNIQPQLFTQPQTTKQTIDNTVNNAFRQEYPNLETLVNEYQNRNKEFTSTGIQILKKEDNDRFIIKSVDESKKKGYSSNDIEMFHEIYNGLKDAVDNKKSKVEQLKLLYAFQNFYNLSDEQINEYALLTGVVKPNNSKKIKEIEQNIINKYIPKFLQEFSKPEDITSKNWMTFKTKSFQDYLRNTKNFGGNLDVIGRFTNSVPSGKKAVNTIYYLFRNNVLNFFPLKDLYPTDEKGELFKIEGDKKYIIWNGKKFIKEKEDKAFKKKSMVLGKLKEKNDGSVEPSGEGMLSVESEIRFMDIVLNKGFKLIASNSKINLDYIRDVTNSIAEGDEDETTTTDGTTATGSGTSSADGGKSLQRKLTHYSLKKRRRKRSGTTSRKRRRGIYKSVKKSLRRKSMKKSLRKLKKLLQKRRSMKIYKN